MPRNMNWSNSVATAVWMSARATRNPVLENMRDTFDSGDAWGSCLAWHFGIADVLTDIDPAQVPSAWEFRQSPMGSDTEAYEYTDTLAAIAELPSEQAQIAALVHAGNVLARYATQLKLAGLDY